ncbi:hypothetical protein C8F01DRAFT_1076072 [Mycena amicta]|nr:hypothetical protein C8F01DRAFT_1076072 [Mycena amicta]
MLKLDHNGPDLSATCAADRARIEQIEAQIRSLFAEKDVLQRRLDSYRYPILTLPNEITGNIFQRYLPEYPKAPPPTGSGSPTLLSHVCRHWRAVALSMSVLWSSIPIFEDLDSQWVPCWLERSRQSPLTIQTWHVADELRDTVMEALIQHRARWEHAHLSIYGSWVSDGLGLLPMLRHIELQVSGDLSSDLRLAEAPLLRSAILWDFRCPPTLLPWYQLRALVLVCQEAQECTPILQQAVNLVYCELVFTEDDSDSILQPDITLPVLEELVLTQFLDERVPTYYLGCFIAPALRRLRVLARVIHPNPVSKVQAFMDKSGCKLENICIVGQRELPKREYRWKAPGLVVTFEDDKDQWLNEETADELREIAGDLARRRANKLKARFVYLRPKKMPFGVDWIPTSIAIPNEMIVLPSQLSSAPLPFGPGLPMV